MAGVGGLHLPVAAVGVHQRVDVDVGEPVRDPAEGKRALSRRGGLTQEADAQVARALVVALGTGRGAVLWVGGNVSDVWPRASGVVCPRLSPYELREVGVGLQDSAGRVDMPRNAAGTCGQHAKAEQCHQQGGGTG